MSKVQKDTKLFFSMIALLKAAQQYWEYIYSNSLVSGQLKKEFGMIFHRLNLLYAGMKHFLGSKDAAKFEDGYSGDFMSIASIFEIWAELDEERRGILEQFAIELKEGTVKVELDPQTT